MAKSTLKFATLATAESLMEKFDLGDYFTVDWEWMCEETDPERLGALVDGLNRQDLTSEERYALLLIVVNSMNWIAHSDTPLPLEQWKTIVAVLRGDRKQYQAIIERFLSLDEEPEDRFALSKHLLAAFPEFDPDANPATGNKG